MELQTFSLLPPRCTSIATPRCISSKKLDHPFPPSWKGMRREYLGCLHLWLIALRGGKGVENLFQFDLYSNWNRGTVSCLALDKRETRFLYETGLQCNTNIDFILLLCEFLLLLFYYSSFNYCLICKKNISFIYFVSNFFNILIRSLKKKITRYIKRIIK